MLASPMQTAAIGELLGTAIEDAAFDQFEIESGRTAEDRVRSGLGSVLNRLARNTLD